MAGQNKATGGFWTYLALGGLLLVAIALGIALYFVRAQEPRLTAAVNEQSETLNVLPREPDGVTIIIKESQESEPTTSETDNRSVGTGSGVKGFAIHLGTAQSFSELSARFYQIGQINQEWLLDEFEPRATLEETANGLEARLMVGPFDSMEAAREVCANIALPSGVECEAGPFSGEVIARE